MTIHFELVNHAHTDTPDGGEDGDTCQLYELPVAWCHHCRTGAIPPRQHQAGARQRGDHTGDGEDTLIVASLAARWPGWCANGDCDRYYQKGSWIHRTSDGNYYCSEC